jgi:ribose 5-phosphate isomerase
MDTITPEQAYKGMNEAISKEKAIWAIAKENGIVTLKGRKSDSLDFYDLGVETIKDMLEKAYEAGAKSK